MLVAVLNVQIRLKQVDDGHTRGCLPVGNGSAFENEPIFACVGAHEFVNQARFSYARFTDHGDNLTSAGRSALPCLAKLVDLGVASNEPREAPGRCRLQPRSYRLRTDDLMGLNRRAHPL